MASTKFKNQETTEETVTLLVHALEVMSEMEYFTELLSHSSYESSNIYTHILTLCILIYIADLRSSPLAWTCYLCLSLSVSHVSASPSVFLSLSSPLFAYIFFSSHLSPTTTSICSSTSPLLLLTHLPLYNFSSTAVSTQGVEIPARKVTAERRSRFQRQC